MNIYRVHRTDETGTSFGYRYFSSRREAIRSMRNWESDNGPETVDLVTLCVEPTKTGILRALNAEASHPDNG